MIRLRIFFFFCLLFLTSAACARAITPGVLVVGIEDNRPPYQFMNNGQADGFCVDLLKDMSKSMGVKLAYVSGSLEALSEYVSTGQIDLLAGYAYSAARDKKIDFSIPQRRVEFVLFVRDDSMTHSIEMLQGKIALKSNSVMVESLKGKFQLMLVKDYTEAFRLLADGNCQGVVATEVEGLYLINHLHLLHIKKASNEVLLDVDYCFGVKDGNIELLRRINLAFEKLKDSGRFEQIYEKWFSTLRTQSLWEIILPYFVSLAVVICLLLGIMLWSWILERQVRAKTIEIKKINESLFLYGNLIKFSGDGVYRYTFDEGKILFANDGLAKILDLDVPGQKLEGQLLKNVLVYTEDSGSVRRAANKKGEIYNLEYHFKTTKGDDRWVVHNSIVTHDAITGVKCVDAVVKDITAIKVAEQKIRASEEYFRTIFASALDGILIADMESKRFTAGNPAICKQLGYTQEEIARLGVNDIHPAADLPYVVSQFERQSKGDFAVAKDIPVVRKDGSLFYADVNAAPLKIGGKTYLLGIFRDITERKKIENDLKAVNRALTMVSEINQALIHESDEKHLLNEACRIAVEIGGYRLAWVGFAENDETKTIRLMASIGFEPGYLENANITWADTERGRGPSGIAIRTGTANIARNIATDPAMLPWRDEALKRGYQSSIALPLTSNGKTFGMIGIYAAEPNAFSEREVAILTELASDLAFGVTSLRLKNEHKLMEETIAQSERFKSEMLQKLNEAQHIASIGSWEWNLQTNQVWWSEQTYRIFGVTPEEFLPSFEGNAKFIHPDDLGKYNAAFDRSLKTGETLDVDIRLVLKEAQLKYIHANGQVVLSDSGQPIRFIGTVMDITERKKNEDELAQYRAHLEELVKARTAELEAANKEMEAFSYSVSHDLRTPLRAINGFAQILLDEESTRLDDEGKRVLRVITDNVNKMGALIDDLLTLSRSGRVEIKKTTVDIMKMVQEVFGELKEPVAKRNIQLIVKDLAPAEVDPILIRQVITNLISNAIKFTRKREFAIIEVGCSIGEKETVYYVKDNGVGFNMQYKDKLFGVFQRLHTTDEFEGTGVGLAIVRRVIQRHSGQVWAESTLNEGATFYFSLPRT